MASLEVRLLHGGVCVEACLRCYFGSYAYLALDGVPIPKLIDNKLSVIFESTEI